MESIDCDYNHHHHNENITNTTATTANHPVRFSLWQAASYCCGSSGIPDNICGFESFCNTTSALQGGTVWDGSNVC